ncbi:MAG TPA: hypothetical protein VGG28_27415 [Kofleriaceae bacterium]|jgi:hypothetical protein
MRIFVLLIALVACDKPDRNKLIECPQWAGSACVGSAAAGPAVGSATMGPLERAAATQPATKSAPKQRVRASYGGGRSTAAATVPPDAPPERTRGLANGVACTYSSDCASGECTFSVCASENGGDKKLGNGVKCTYSSDCASGECTYGACASQSGDKQLGTGVACTYDSDCASDHCTYSKCADD